MNNRRVDRPPRERPRALELSGASQGQRLRVSQQVRAGRIPESRDRPLDPIGVVFQHRYVVRERKRARLDQRKPGVASAESRGGRGGNFA